jgi:hypothetical protein
MFMRSAGSADEVRSWSVNSVAAILTNALPIRRMIKANDAGPRETGDAKSIRGDMRLPTFDTTIGTGGWWS